jgi:hypothetical protein
MSGENSEPATVDRLRADIDRGLIKEKVPAQDPAAAPMATDAEAGGAPPQRRERQIEQRSRTEDPPTQYARFGAKAWIGIVSLLVALILVMTIVAAS